MSGANFAFSSVFVWVSVFFVEYFEYSQWVIGNYATKQDKVVAQKRVKSSVESYFRLMPVSYTSRQRCIGHTNWDGISGLMIEKVSHDRMKANVWGIKMQNI